MASDPRLPSAKTGDSRVRNQGLLRTVFFGSSGLRVVWRLVIYFAILVPSFYGLLKGAGALLRALHWHLHNDFSGAHPVEGLLLGEFLLFLAAVIAMAAMARLEKRSATDYWIPRKNAFGRNFWQGLAWGLIASSAIVLLIWVNRGYSFGTFALSGRELIRYTLIWAAAALVNAFAENLAILGYPLFSLTSAVGFWPSALFLTGVFTLAHLANSGENPLGLVSIFLQGFFLCLTICRTGDLWFSVGLHAGGIFAEDFLLSAPDSGTNYTGHLLKSSFYGPAWLTGGSVGPEASAMAFFVLLLALLIFNRTHRERLV